MIKTLPIHLLPLWDKAEAKRTLLSITLEITARCNNNCSHCYINLPKEDKQARAEELSLEAIKNIIDESVSLGTLWFLISGGEPLLRKDFIDIYLYLKQKGMLVSVFTNATLINDEHIALFKKYPPRDIEISVYGATPEIHNSVTRKNTFSAFVNGIEKLKMAKIPFTLKTTVIRDNHREFDKIRAFCSTYSDLAFRFDPFLQLRLDRNPEKNKEIKAQRLNIQEVLYIEKKDPDRFAALNRKCALIQNPTQEMQQKLEQDLQKNPDKLFRCVAGINSCCIGYDGTLKLCTALNNDSCTYDLKVGSLSQGWTEFLPKVRSLRSISNTFKTKCGSCRLIDLCMWCPAHADLETGQIDCHVPFFCDMAMKRFTAC